MVAHPPVIAHTTHTKMVFFVSRLTIHSVDTSTYGLQSRKMTRVGMMQEACQSTGASQLSLETLLGGDPSSHTPKTHAFDLWT
jgi:hypothetical protein